MNKPRPSWLNKLYSKLVDNSSNTLINRLTSRNYPSPLKELHRALGLLTEHSRLPFRYIAMILELNEILPDHMRKDFDEIINRHNGIITASLVENDGDVFARLNATIKTQLTPLTTPLEELKALKDDLNREDSRSFLLLLCVLFLGLVLGGYSVSDDERDREARDAIKNDPVLGNIEIEPKQQDDTTILKFIKESITSNLPDLVDYLLSYNHVTNVPNVPQPVEPQLIADINNIQNRQIALAQALIHPQQHPLSIADTPRGGPVQSTTAPALWQGLGNHHTSPDP